MYRFNEHSNPQGQRCNWSHAAVSDNIAEFADDPGTCWDDCPDSRIEPHNPPTAPTTLEEIGE